MALATFKDLCIDADDPAVIGRFYAGLLGLQLNTQDSGDTYLTGPTAQHTIWVNRVPEPHTAKNRMHIDVVLDSVDTAVRLGASVLDELHGWTVLADPEGGEFCGFVRSGSAGPGMNELNIDAADALAQAQWWGEVFGAAVQQDAEDGYSWIEPVAGAPFSGIVFAEVPEPKTVKNRVHFDVIGDPELLEAHGATVLAKSTATQPWTVLADPEGNEFCVFAAADA